MTVALIVAYQNGTDRKGDAVSIATSDEFRQFWTPLADKLGLPLVRSFQDAITVPRDYIGPIVDELERLEEHLLTGNLTEAGIELGQAEHMVYRIRRLIVHLRRLKLQEAWTASIG
jgi:hypothetical protein